MGEDDVFQVVLVQLQAAVVLLHLVVTVWR